MRKVAGEADKLRQLGTLISRLRRPGIVYCATVRAVDELYVALRHGKIPVERYNGKMTTGRAREVAGVVHAVGPQGRHAGDQRVRPRHRQARHPLHHPLPDAGLARGLRPGGGARGRDGKPSRCVLLFQPDDIAIQEHFLKEAHPTKSQARMVAEGLYAWSDEGKEVSVRDLAMSMALPERRVRVILSVLEAMGVAEEVKAARWKGVEPNPTREQIDKAAMVFEARRISDRRRLESLLKLHEHAALPRADAARLLRRARRGKVRALRFGRRPRQRGLRYGVVRRAARAARRDRLPRAPAASQARTRRLRPAGAAAPQRRRAASAGRPRYETAIPTDLLPPLEPFEIPLPSDGRAPSTRRSGPTPEELGATALSGEVVIDPADDWTAPACSAAPARAEVAAAQAPAAATERRRCPRGRRGRRARRPLGRHPRRQHSPLPRLAPRRRRYRCRRWWSVRDNMPARPAAPHAPRWPPAATVGRPGYNGPGPRTAVEAAVAAAVVVAQRAAAGRGRDRDRDRPETITAPHRDRGPRLPGFYNPGGDCNIGTLRVPATSRDGLHEQSPCWQRHRNP